MVIGLVFNTLISNIKDSVEIILIEAINCKGIMKLKLSMAI